MAEATIFVVDDDPSVRKSLSRLMRSHGYHIETFPSAEAFLGHELPEAEACLVLDVRLPGPSGLDLQDAISRSERRLPIIFITGHGDVSTSVHALKAGAFDFLEKPVNGRDLVAAIERALARDREAIGEREVKREIQSRVDSLTPREREVLALVVTGMLNKQIGGELGAAEKTIKIHRARVMEKMKAGSVAELVRLAEKVGIGGGAD